jgi:hypothetical protein
LRHDSFDLLAVYLKQHDGHPKAITKRNSDYIFAIEKIETWTDYQNIIETVTNVFTATDERNWALVKQSFADHVLLDYSSMTKQPAASLAADDIITAWEGNHAWLSMYPSSTGQF